MTSWLIVIWFAIGLILNIWWIRRDLMADQASPPLEPWPCLFIAAICITLGPLVLLAMLFGRLLADGDEA